MTSTRIALELMGIALGGIIIGGIIGGALHVFYRAIDADRSLPKWADMLGTGCAYGIAAIVAWVACGHIAEDLAELGTHTAQVVGSVGALFGPTGFPPLQRRLLGYIANGELPQKQDDRR